MRPMKSMLLDKSATQSQVWPWRLFFLGLVLLLAFPWPGHAQAVTLVAGGDLAWAIDLKPPNIFQKEIEGWRALPYVLAPEKVAELQGADPPALRAMFADHESAISYGLRFDSDEEEARYPFQRIRPLFQAADMSFANLETALSASGRRAYDGALLTPPPFAKGIHWAGIDIVSIANNRVMDAEGEGLLHTMDHLRRASVAFVGGGRNLREARAPSILEKKGVRVAFLAYTQFVNPSERLNGFASPDNPGLAPMDPWVIKEDIERVREDVDHIVVSLHWGTGGANNSSTVVEPHPVERDIARELIDAGADVILGHHPPLPRGVELYKGKPIFYSLGKLVFGHNHAEWTDNIVVRISFEDGGIGMIEILPVAGEGMDLAQPYPLEGDRALAVLEIIRQRSAAFGTEIRIEGWRGVIQP